MLPADGARRLVSLLTQALDGCTEQKKKLQQKIKQCQDLLQDWNSEVSENAALEGCKDNHEACAENEPSAKELEELELLNKALEKALRVRTKFQPAPGEGAKPAGEKAASGTPMSLQVGNASKESTSRIGRAVPVICKPASPKWSMTYMPKAPYRTDPVVKRRPLGKTSARPSTRASKMLGRKRPATGTASLVATVPVTVTQPGREQSCVAKEPGKQAPCAFEASVGQRDAAAGANPLSPETESDLSAAQAQVISTLREKGSLLELPHPYKKAFSKYMRLLGKCHNCQTSPEAVAARNHFMEKMQTTAVLFILMRLLEKTQHGRESMKASSLWRVCKSSFKSNWTKFSS
nr:tubulin epsilon and delta complex protein 2 isoform X3 [Anolis sagrei ordinatus]XP_060642183.1 tubulin epsilon and delta complex protein 2 isoform X3 [Anolis sagrei ordinatus]